MKQLVLKISNCRNCPYSSSEKHKWICLLSDRKLNYYANIIEKAILNDEIPNWCELEEMDRGDESNVLAI